jgi:hypothetical protein
MLSKKGFINLESFDIKDFEMFHKGIDLAIRTLMLSSKN